MQLEPARRGLSSGSRRRLLSQLAAGAGLSLNGLGSDAATGFWQLARAPDAVFLMRHAQTEPGVGDPPDFRLGQCQTQRNLDARGRRQAVSVGQAFGREGVAPAQVLSSAWCRCIDTARLAFGRVEVMPDLNSFFAGPGGAGAQTRNMIDFLRQPATAGSQMLVTHQVNISALTGEPSEMGEILLVARPAQTVPAPAYLQVLSRWNP